MMTCSNRNSLTTFTYRYDPLQKGKLIEVYQQILWPTQ